MYKGVEEMNQHTVPREASAECELRGDVWAYSDILGLVGQEVHDPLANGCGEC